MKHIEDYCVLINNIRMQGGTYTYTALVKALKGIPYNNNMPMVMRANPGIAGFEVLDKGIRFDTSKSIHKDAIAYLIEEARQYGIRAANKSRIKHSFVALLNTDIPSTPLYLKSLVDKRCVELYYEGKSAKSAELLDLYKRYVNGC